MFGSIFSIIFTGLAIGGLARWAVPGPDPMPLWLTLGVGLAGALVGGGITASIAGTSSRGDIFAILLVSIGASSLLVIAYRRFVQHRPITGPEARKLPTKGIGVGRLRERLQRLGVDPDSVGSPDGPRPQVKQPDRTTETLRKLEELHSEGLLTDEEFQAKRTQLLER